MKVLGHRFDGPPSAPVLLLLNGGLMTITAWEPIAAELAKEFRVLRCDLRGQVLSPGVPSPSIDAHAREVIALLDEVQVERAHVAGVSFGALVATRLAACAPERVCSLVLMNTTGVISDEVWRAGLPVVDACRAAAEGRGDGGRVFELLVPGTFSPAFVAANAEFLASRARQFSRLGASQFESFLGILHALEGLDLRADAAQVRVPAMVVGATGDVTFAEPASSELAQTIPGARLEFVDGPHGVVVENPAALLEPLTRFLRDLT